MSDFMTSITCQWGLLKISGKQWHVLVIHFQSIWTSQLGIPGKNSLQRIVDLVRLFGCWISGYLKCLKKKIPTKIKTKKTLTNYKQYSFVYVINYFLCFHKWFCQNWIFFCSVKFSIFLPLQCLENVSY